MASIPFETALSRVSVHKRFCSCPGTRVWEELKPVFDRAGVWHLESTGKEIDKYLEIQAYKNECDINVLMARYRNGETDVLARVQGVYGDFSNIPTNYAEIMNEKLRAEQLFYGLAADVREKYNNSVEQFMAEIGTKAGLEKLGVKFEQPAPAPAPAEEVKDDA